MMKSPGGALLFASLSLIATSVHAQASDRDPSIANLPRRGYDPRAIRAGKAVIQPSIEADATRDNNIFATETREVADTIFSVRPNVTVDRKSRTLDLHTEARANFIRYASHPRENVSTFGAGLNATKTVANGHALLFDLAFDRTFQRRSDPEADLDRALRPVLINIATGELRYQYRGSRIGFSADAAVTQYDYLPASEAERDMKTYRASLRGLLNLTRRVSLYVEPYVNRRDFRLPRAQTGIVGDTTTWGGMLGLAFDIGDLLQGEIGGGYFSAEPDAAKSFTGLAVNGRVTWRPVVRTAFVLSAFRGDVATVRVGSLGRVDTRLSLSVDQEARHNLLLHAAVGVRNVRYRGGANNNQTYHTGELEARYLLNRHLSLVAEGGYARRTAHIPDQRFDRLRATLGARLIY